MEEKAIQEKLKQAKSKLSELLLERYEHYVKWQDFNERGCPSKQAMQALKDRQTAVNRQHGQVDKLKRELGYPESRIKEEDLRKVTNPHANPKCKILLAA